MDAVNLFIRFVMIFGNNRKNNWLYLEIF
jgi:hypothetical protein